MKKFFKQQVIQVTLLIMMVLILGGFSSATEKKDFSKFTICIDAGHQSKGNSKTEPIAPGSKTMKAKVSSGTTGVSTRIPEYKLTLALALKLKKLLVSKGFNVVMTRETNNVDISNIERAEIGNKAGADLSVRIHADGSPDKNMHGVSVLYPALAVTEKINTKSKLAAMEVLNGVIDTTAAKSLGIKPRVDLTGFNWTRVPSILIETGFMTNASEDKRLEQQSYQQKIVAGIEIGIEKYLDEK